MTALALTVVPTMLYSWLLWRLDCYEKEPWSLLFAAFIWGAIPALLVSGGLELTIANLLPTAPRATLSTATLAPFVEEPLKALALIGLFRFAHQEFDDVVDGIIYGALVGFGFAMSENLLYFWSHPGQMLSLWILRSILFGSTHAFYTSIVGIALGLVRFDRRRWVGIVAFPLALAGAILLHSVHNDVVARGLWGLGTAWILNNGGVLIVLLVAFLGRHQEQRWLTGQLPDECDDIVLDDNDLRRLINPTTRMRTEVTALLSQGWNTYRSYHRYHHLLTELAFRKHQLACGDRGCCVADVDRLRTLVIQQRVILRSLQ